MESKKAVEVVEGRILRQDFMTARARSLWLEGRNVSVHQREGKKVERKNEQRGQIRQTLDAMVRFRRYLDRLRVVASVHDTMTYLLDIIPVKLCRIVQELEKMVERALVVLYAFDRFVLPRLGGDFLRFCTKCE